MACEPSIKQILHTLIVPKFSYRCGRACCRCSSPPSAGPEHFSCCSVAKYSFVMLSLSLSLCSDDSCSRRVYLIFFGIFGLWGHSSPVGADYDIRHFGVALQCHVCAQQGMERGAWQAVCFKLLLNAATFLEQREGEGALKGHLISILPELLIAFVTASSARACLSMCELIVCSAEKHPQLSLLLASLSLSLPLSLCLPVSGFNFNP